MAILLITKKNQTNIKGCNFYGLHILISILFTATYFLHETKYYKIILWEGILHENIILRFSRTRLDPPHSPLLDLRRSLDCRGTAGRASGPHGIFHYDYGLAELLE